MRQIDILNFILDLFSELQTAFQTFQNYSAYIYHMLTTPYTNSPIEVIKHIAFGYRSFYYFKSRILMIQNLTQSK